MSAETFFTPLLARDPSGRDWLPSILRAAPRAAERLGELVDHPGSLSMTLSVRGVSGRLGAFEYPLAPSPGLVAWLIEHPEALSWPERVAMSPAALRLRRALVRDEPPGARVRAQERARELLATRSVLSEEWWRFEEVGALDCLLMTDRMVVTVDGSAGDPRRPVTPWQPERSRLVRTIEAARELAAGRQWGCLLMTDEPLDVDGLLGDEALATAAPHLDPAGRAQLREGYLGNLTWAAAAQAAEVTPGPELSA